jgi:hypothetical protein
MRLSHWFMLVGLLVGVGCLKVAQRTAILRSGYAVAQGEERVHAAEGDLRWTQATVIRLSGPARLSRAAQERHPEMVAWSHLPLQPPKGALREAQDPPDQQRGVGWSALPSSSAPLGMIAAKPADADAGSTGP